MYVEYLKLCPSRVRQREREERDGRREGGRAWDIPCKWNEPKQSISLWKTTDMTNSVKQHADDTVTVETMHTYDWVGPLWHFYSTVKWQHSVIIALIFFPTELII